MVIAGVGVVCVLALDCFHVICIRFPRFVNNNPLLSPIRISRQKSDVFQVEDGRLIQLSSRFLDSECESKPGDWTIDSLLKITEGQIDLEQVDENTFEVYAAVPRNHIPVGAFWGLIGLPLIPHNLPANVRRRIGDAKLLSQPDQRSPSKAHANE